METELIPGMSVVEESQFLSLLESQTTDLELEIAKLEFVVREKSVERGFEYEKKRYHRILKQNEEFHRTNKPLLSDFKLNVLETASTSLIDTIKTFIADFGDNNEVSQAKRVRDVIKKLNEELGEGVRKELDTRVKKKARIFNNAQLKENKKRITDLIYKKFPLRTWLVNNYHAMSHPLILKIGPDVHVNENGEFHMVHFFSQFITVRYHYEVRHQHDVFLMYTLDLDTEHITIVWGGDENNVHTEKTKVTAWPDEVMESFRKFVAYVEKAREMTSNDP